MRERIAVREPGPARPQAAAQAPELVQRAGALPRAQSIPSAARRAPPAPRAPSRRRQAAAQGMRVPRALVGAQARKMTDPAPTSAPRASTVVRAVRPVLEQTRLIAGRPLHRTSSPALPAAPP